MPNRILQFIDPAERASAIKAGAYLRMSDEQLPIDELDARIKQAADSILSPSTAAKTVIALSVLTGIPMGIAAHVVGNRISKERLEEKELITASKYYQNAAQQLQSRVTPVNTNQGR